MQEQSFNTCQALDNLPSARLYYAFASGKRHWRPPSPYERGISWRPPGTWRRFVDASGHAIAGKLPIYIPE